MIEKFMLYVILVAVHSLICSQGACVYCLKLDIPAYSMRHGKRFFSLFYITGIGDDRRFFSLFYITGIGDDRRFFSLFYITGIGDDRRFFSLFYITGIGDDKRFFSACFFAQRVQ
jgi:hypothetical protein